jgi:hypothetical protein
MSLPPSPNGILCKARSLSSESYDDWWRSCVDCGVYIDCRGLVGLEQNPTPRRSMRTCALLSSSGPRVRVEVVSEPNRSFQAMKSLRERPLVPGHGLRARGARQTATKPRGKSDLGFVHILSLSLYFCAWLTLMLF